MTKNAFKKPKAPSMGTLLSRSLEFSGAPLPQDVEVGEVQHLPINVLQPNPRQPRRFFNEERLRALAESIREEGVLQPLMVRPLEGGQFEIVYGERRWRAAQLAGLPSVPARVRTLTDAQVELLAAIENLQREDLNRYDEVSYKLRLVAALFQTTPEEAIQRLRELRNQPESDPEQVNQLEHLFTQLGREKWPSFVTNGLPALRLPEALVEAVQTGKLEYTKALLIARAPQEHHTALLKWVLEEELSHAALTDVVAQLKPTPRSDADAQLLSLRRKISPRRLGKLPREQRVEAEKLIRRLHELLGD
ncbi:ParB/RepB/Spo0J family partition protein [Deinococcus planocerae]|uniref:ParB/RepB/Spo0J family partition protein n=1 Tax=Deinococcus planocerae TaxID=1737569 RepID=UPI000C7F23A6|nr:ParB/RepB/Spo0J family partition protein [Deinococcus planocerae]